MSDIGKTLVILGIVIILVGLLLNSPIKIPLIGKLPGDILIKREGFTFYFPLTTSILISLLISLIFRIFNK